MDDNALIGVMLANPILIERPIVVSGDKATIGRPPEKVLEIVSPQDQASRLELASTRSPRAPRPSILNRREMNHTGKTMTAPSKK